MVFFVSVWAACIKSLISCGKVRLFNVWEGLVVRGVQRGGRAQLPPPRCRRLRHQTKSHLPKPQSKLRFPLRKQANPDHRRRHRPHLGAQDRGSAWWRRPAVAVAVCRGRLDVPLPLCPGLNNRPTKLAVAVLPGLHPGTQAGQPDNVRLEPGAGTILGQPAPRPGILPGPTHPGPDNSAALAWETLSQPPRDSSRRFVVRASGLYAPGSFKCRKICIKKLFLKKIYLKKLRCVLSLRCNVTWDDCILL